MTDRHLIISNNTELVRVAPERIVYLEADGNYTTLILTDGEKRVLTFNLGTFQSLIEAQLGNEACWFVRIGKSLIINRNYIYVINVANQQLTMSDTGFREKYKLRASQEALRELKKMLELTLKK
ncbi:MAG: LytTR family transcriptional regulator DNA-binding domain-containing protein [Tannerella sp.]|jgi:DNA-binding LytR/AlgR family response regulator|nr:LytTR family transcriptional regulator DNA-binding domain-containing protein [Tannerella sp.]